MGRNHNEKFGHFTASSILRGFWWSREGHRQELGPKGQRGGGNSAFIGCGLLKGTFRGGKTQRKSLGFPLADLKIIQEETGHFFFFGIFAEIEGGASVCSQPRPPSAPLGGKLQPTGVLFLIYFIYFAWGFWVTCRGGCSFGRGRARFAAPSSPNFSTGG